jgi:integrase
VRPKYCRKDLPIVENQHQPTFSAEAVSSNVQKANDQERVLYALLTGTGLRIGEPLGLEIRHVSHDCRAISIEQSCWEGEIQSPKTRNAYRQVDVHSALAPMLKAFIGARTSGLLFANRNGKPLSQTNVVRRSLHTILEDLKIEKTGFHALRRFRTTWLRKQRAPEDLIQFGHAKKSVTDGYSKLADDVEFRSGVAEKIGTGFHLPDLMIPMVLRISEEGAAVAAG